MKNWNLVALTLKIALPNAPPFIVVQKTVVHIGPAEPTAESTSVNSNVDDDLAKNRSLLRKAPSMSASYIRFGLFSMRRSQIVTYLLFAIFCISYVGVSNAQTPPGAPEDNPIKVSTVLVNIPVVISDSKGRNIVGLRKEDFSISQDGQKQPIEFFADNEGSMNVAIIIDTSGSTANVIGAITNAARDFVKLFGPADTGIVVGFNSEVNMLLTSFTSDRGKLGGAINHASTVEGAGSVMNDAVYRVVTREFAKIKGRKAIIVLTDGDVDGKVSAEKLLETLLESDILVYPIFFQTRRLLPSKVKTVSFADLVKLPPVNYLNSLAVVTGGRLYAANGNDFASAFQNIAAELKKQYVIGFYPLKTGNQDFNNVKIEVNRSDVIVRSKQTFRVRLPAPKDKPSKRSAEN